MKKIRSTHEKIDARDLVCHEPVLQTRAVIEETTSMLDIVTAIQRADNVINI